MSGRRDDDDGVIELVLDEVGGGRVKAAEPDDAGEEADFAVVEDQNLVRRVVTDLEQLGVGARRNVLRVQRSR
jgi:hypothetical protein